MPRPRFRWVTQPGERPHWADPAGRWLGTTPDVPPSVGTRNPPADTGPPAWHQVGGVGAGTPSGGAAGLVNPPQAPNERTLGEYRTPAQNQQALLDAGQTHAQVHQAALTYANQRLATLRTIASVVNDPTLRDILGGKLGPLEKYAVASKRWAELAKADGYADPRAWLQDKMKQWQTS
jgi:hypothetical protein